MHTPIQYGTKRRIEWSALLLFVMGLVSMATPHRMVHATVHHQHMPSSSGTRTSRSSRQNGRSARGGLRTEMDMHEASHDRSLQGVRPHELQSAVAPVDVAAVTPAFLLAPSLARSALAVSADDDAVVLYQALPSRGRAPPVL